MGSIWETLKNEKLLTRHYYGDLVRFLFMLAAIIMLITLPFLIGKLPVPLYISIMVILAIGVLAGITNPLQKWISILNGLISTAALFIFEFYAVNSFSTSGVKTLYFITNQLLAVVFLFALYYSIKTLRAMFIKETPQD
ncbi:MAG: hypothetical protein UT00_C0013G0004 [Parcubacteria group bacterium GW2011_GWA1_38_7]|nr:MAG: hypothetical protein UT00_C0013G0004 [Parcubacteria group bacterium GW2011_GWA1_38_7]